MHGYSVSRPCLQDTGQVVYGGRPTPRAADDTHAGSTAFPTQSSLAVGSLLVTFPGDDVSSPRGESLTERSVNHSYHINNRGARVKRLLEAKTEALETPYRYKKFSPRAETPPDQLPVCNLNKLNAMLDAEARPHGDILPNVSPRGKGKGKNTIQRPSYSYGIVENSYHKLEQLRKEKNKEKERDRRREKQSEAEQSGDNTAADKPVLEKSSHSTASSSTGSFLRGSAIESSDERPVRARRPSYDARAYANKGPKRRSRDKGKLEKFSSLPNISKYHNLTSTQCTAYTDPTNGVETTRSSYKPIPKIGDHSTTSKRPRPDQSTKLPRLSGSSDIRSEISTDEGKVRMTQSEPGSLAIPYSFHGSSSKANTRQKILSLREMTEAFRQHMGDRYGRPSVNEDKRWADKLTKGTSVVDNNSYDMYARKPLPKYSVSKLVLSHAAQFISTDDMSSTQIQDGGGGENGEDEADDLDLPVGYINTCDYDYNEYYDEEPYEVHPVPVPPEWEPMDIPWEYDPLPAPGMVHGEYSQPMDYNYTHTSQQIEQDHSLTLDSEKCGDEQGTSRDISNTGHVDEVGGKASSHPVLVEVTEPSVGYDVTHPVAVLIPIATGAPQTVPEHERETLKDAVTLSVSAVENEPPGVIQSDVAHPLPVLKPVGNDKARPLPGLHREAPIHDMAHPEAVIQAGMEEKPLSTVETEPPANSEVPIHNISNTEPVRDTEALVTGSVPVLKPAETGTSHSVPGLEREPPMRSKAHPLSLQENQQSVMTGPPPLPAVKPVVKDMAQPASVEQSEQPINVATSPVSVQQTVPHGNDTISVVLVPNISANEAVRPNSCDESHSVINHYTDSVREHSTDCESTVSSSDSIAGTMNRSDIIIPADVGE